MTANGEFAFRSEDWLLLHSVLNEILNGFALDNFDAVIGINRTDLQQLLDYLHDLPEGEMVQLKLNQTIAFRNALRETLRELGTTEFHARTGYHFEGGQRVLDKLDDLIKQSRLTPSQ